MVAGRKQHCFHQNEWRWRTTGLNTCQTSHALVDLACRHREWQRKSIVQGAHYSSRIHSEYSWRHKPALGRRRPDSIPFVSGWMAASLFYTFFRWQRDLAHARKFYGGAYQPDPG